MKKAGAKTVRDNKEKSPRANVVMDVETGGARKELEIPFVIGVMADLSGKNKGMLDPLSQRKFIEVAGSLDPVFKKARPRVTYEVPNRMTNDGTMMKVDMEFASMDSFRPDAVAMALEPLRKVMEEREKLKQLLTLIDGDDQAEAALEKLERTIQELFKDVSQSK